LKVPMNSVLMQKKHNVSVRRSYTATQLIASLAQLEGWKLCGDGPAVAIEKTYAFANYLETIAFVNAVAFMAERQDHHPEMLVTYNRCTLRWNTHDVGGISVTDFECAAAADALVADPNQTRKAA
jgi:4a-hydroxytetrahydrobiopterin dehydratase